MLDHPSASRRQRRADPLLMIVGLCFPFCCGGRERPGTAESSPKHQAGPSARAPAL